MFHYVYLIQHTDTKEKYLGRTDDLTQRLKEHNARGKKATTRNSQGEWVYVYAEAFRHKQDAINRESQLKNHGAGKRELFKRLENSLV
tara:strand:- start:454 stop:717 length:264 start_codon:yes stop_codon:yes gene_type:complete